MNDQKCTSVCSTSSSSSGSNSSTTTDSDAKNNKKNVASLSSKPESEHDNNKSKKKQKKKPAVDNQEFCEKLMAHFGTSDEVTKDDSIVGDGAWDISVPQVKHSKLTNVNCHQFHDLNEWTQALQMIKTLHKDYKQVFINWKASGEHRGVTDVLEGMALDIAEFTKKQPVILYFFLLLHDNPNIHSTVNTNLPDDCIFDSGVARKPKAESKKQKNKSGRANGLDGPIAKLMTDLAATAAAKVDQDVAAKKQKELLNLDHRINCLDEKIERKEKSESKLKKDIKKKAQSARVVLTQESADSLVSLQKKLVRVREEIGTYNEDMGTLRAKKKKLEGDVDQFGTN